MTPASAVVDGAPIVATTPGRGGLLDLMAVWGPRVVTLGLVLLCFSGRWGELGVPLPLDRPVLVAGLGMCALAFFGRGGRLALRPVHLLMAAALAWAVLSALAAGTYGGNGLFALLDRFGILPFLMFVLAPAVYRDPASRRFLSRSFAVLGLYLGVMALFQALDLDSLVWPAYIVDPSVGIHVDRARGPYVESVANGLMLITCGAFGGVLSATDRSGRWRLLGAVTLVLCSVGVILTLTRAIWLGAAVAAALTVLAVPRLRRWAPVLAVTAAATIALAFATIPGLSVGVSERSLEESPVWDRFNTNWAAVRMMLEHPLTGVGWQQAPARMQDFVRQGESYPVTASSVGLEVHNVFLSRFAELGVLGAALWVAALGAAVLFPLLRRPETRDLDAWRVVLLCVSAAWGVAALLGPLTYPQPNYLLWGLGGVVLAHYLTGRAPSGERAGDLAPDARVAASAART